MSKKCHLKTFKLSNRNCQTYYRASIVALDYILLNVSEN